MSARTRACVECGAPLAPSSPVQLCGKCLLFEGSDSDGDSDGDRSETLLKVPGHEVLEEIARGGMGVVYLARERETRRSVALKMLRPRLADEEGMRERFRMEASAMAALHHPNILPVYRVDESDEMPFFTMKLAGGGTLADRRASFRGKWRDIASLMVTLADAVQYAHQHGVLHRDLKPANVLFDEEGRAYLTDFGLVKLIDSVSELTGSQSFLGTPHYSSPEVASSNASVATVASDVWSLGAMLYELLADRLPFDAPGLAPLLRKIAEEPPAPFPAANAPPGDLRVITSKCLHKEPAQRYQSAADLASDLKAWLAGRPITARAASLPERLVAWAKRNPGLAATVAALVVSLALLGGLLWRGYAASRQAAADARAGESAARAAEAASLLEETRARLRGGQWVNRSQSVAAIRRSHELQPSGAARDVLVSLLALPELKATGAIPYLRQNPNPVAVGAPVFLDGNFSRYVARTSNATEVRDALSHEVLLTVPETAASGHEPGPLSPDGHLLSLRTTSGISVWKVDSGTKAGTLPAGRRMHGFSRDSSVMAAGRRLLQLTTEPPASLEFPDPECEVLAVSPDGKLLLTAHRSRLLMRLVDPSGSEPDREYELPGKSTMLRAAWSADGRHFYTGATDGRMMRWKVTEPKPEWIVPAHTDGIDDIALFDDDRHLITVSRDGLTKIWNLHTQTSVAAFALSGRRAQVASDGRRLALDSALERKTLLFEFTPPPVCTLVRLPASYVPDSSLQGKGAVITAADGSSFAATAGFDLHLLDRDGTLLRSIPCGQCADLVVDPSGSGFIRSRRLTSNVWELMRVPPVWDRDYGDAALSLGRWNRLPSLAIPAAAAGSFVAGVGSAINEIEPASARRTPRTPSALPARGRVTALTFSPCGRYFAWAGVEDANDPARRIHLMDAAGENELAIIPVREAPRLLVFMPSGDSLIAANNNAFHCLDTATGRELWRLPHSRAQEPSLKTPVCLAIAGQTGTLAIPLTADSVSLVDAATGGVRLTLRHPMGQTLRAVGLSPDGTRLVAVGSYIAQVWKLDAAAEELARHGMGF